MEGQRKLNKKAWSWAFYDWANSGFSTTVMACILYTSAAADPS